MAQSLIVSLSLELGKAATDLKPQTQVLRYVYCMCTSTSFAQKQGLISNTQLEKNRHSERSIFLGYQRKKTNVVQSLPC